MPAVYNSSLNASTVSSADGDHREIQNLSSTPTPLNSLEHALDSRNPVIVKAAILFLVGIVNLVGNSIALATIRATPKLRTKMFRMLASLTLADLFTGLTMFWVIGYQLVVYVFSDEPCAYIILVAALTPPSRYPAYVSTTHAVLVSIERYVAVVYPFQYETKFTDNTIKALIAFGWIWPGFVASLFWLYFDKINWSLCVITDSVFQSTVTDTVCLLFVFTLVIVLYWRILTVALQQRAKINAEMAVIQAATASGQMLTVVCKKQRGEMKAVRLTAYVTGAIVVLWIPYIVGGLILLSRVNPVIGQYVSDVGLVVGIFNSCINWIIYGAVSKEFRQSVWKLFGLRQFDNTVHNQSTVAVNRSIGLPMA